MNKRATETVTMCDCGHAPTQTNGPGTGYARHSVSLRTMCYECADKQEREDLARATSYGAYVNEDRREVTTWTGGRLARLTSVHTARSGFAGTLRYVTAVDDNGNIWRGKGSAEYDAVTLRRAS